MEKLEARNKEARTPYMKFELPLQKFLGMEAADLSQSRTGKMFQEKLSCTTTLERSFYVIFI